jgi:hypothetical protein
MPPGYIKGELKRANMTYNGLAGGRKNTASPETKAQVDIVSVVLYLTYRLFNR